MAGDNLLFMQKRSIAGYIPNVIIEERHDDFIAITEHPVEEGAAITDHAYKEPARLLMRVLWGSGASSYIGLLFGQAFTTTQEAYNALLNLQQSRQPFDVVTGKRSYANMLLERLTVTTDIDTENILEVMASFQQVIIVGTLTINLQGLNLQNTSIPSKLNAVKNKGTKQLVTTVNSASTASTFGYYGVPIP